MKRSIKLDEKPLSNGEIMEVLLDFQKGGMSYFTGQNSRRGYYLVVRRCKLTKITSTDGKEIIMRSMSLFDSGVKQLLAETARFSQKELEKHAAAVKTDPIYQQLIQNELTTIGATIKEGSIEQNYLPNDNSQPAQIAISA